MSVIALFTLALAAPLPRSEALLLRGEVDAAIRAASEEVDRAPDDVEAAERLIDLFLAVGVPERAERFARARVQAHPDAPDAHYLLGRALVEVDAATRAYERALKLDPLHGRSYMGMGAIHTAKGDPVSAAAAYGRAVQLDPSLAEAWLGLVRAHLARDDRQTAIQVARKGVESIPGSADLHLTLVALEPQRERELLRRAVEAAGHDPRLHARYADRLLHEGAAEEALREALAALAIDPSSREALRVELFARQMLAKTLDLQGLLALERGEDPDALVARYPSTPVTWLARARVRLERDDERGALADLRRAQQLAPDTVEVLGQLGMLLAHLGEHAEAAQLLRRAYEARRWDTSLGVAAASAQAKAGMHREAIASLRELSARAPYDSQVAIALADALLLAGQTEQAYRVVLQAAERKTDPAILVALMTAAAQSGRYDEAAGILEQIGRTTQDPKALELAARLRAKARRP